MVDSRFFARLARVVMVTIAPLATASGAAVVPATLAAQTSAVERAGFADGASPSEASGLTLDELFAWADLHAPSLRRGAVATEIAVARGRASDRRLPELPEVSLAGGVRRTAEGTGVEWDASISQAIDVARTWRARREVAERGVDAAAAAHGAARWELRVALTRDVAEVVAARARRTLAERFVGFSDELVRIARAQVDAGVASPLVLTLLAADRAQLEERALLAARDERRALREVEARIGWIGPESLRIAVSVDDLVAGATAERTPSASEAPHPVLAARRAAEGVWAAERDRAARARWQPLTLGVDYAREAELPLQPSAHIAMLRVGVPLPFWHPNEREIAIADAEWHAAVLETSIAEEELLRAIAQADDAVQFAEARQQLHAQHALPRLEEHLRAMQRAFELGEVGAHEVALAQERLLRAATLHVEATHEALVARVVRDGLVASHGGWP